MIICINPECQNRQNPDSSTVCRFCGNPLLINDRYRLLQPLRPLHARHSTEVFEVDDRGTRKVMKVLTSNRSDEIERFDRESSILQLMNAPGIPKVELDGYFPVSLSASSRTLHCFVMDKVEGVNLEKWIETSGRISQKLALKWLKQLIDILNYLHKEGFFHRDIKPSNIMCQPNGQLVLIDFGSFREMTDTYLAKIKRDPNTSANFKGITTIISSGYTAPEQIEGRSLPQSDFFALGRTFVHLLTGKHPIELPIDPATGQLKWRKFAPQITPLLAEFIDELMAPLPRNRPPNSDAILQQLKPNRLYWRRVQRFLNSTRFKVMVAIFIALAMMYRLSFPWISQSFYDRAWTAQQANDFTQARHYYTQALKFNSKDARIYNNLGILCQNQNDLKCAMEYYQKVIDLDENSGTFYNLAQVYEQAGEFDRAEEPYKKAIELGGVTVDYSLSGLARLYIFKGNLDQAIELSLQGLQQSQKPNVRSALYRNLGWIFWIQGDYTKAEENLQQALELQEDRTEAYCLLALVREAQGRTPQALDQWKSCLDGDVKQRVEISVLQTFAQQRLNTLNKKT